MLLNINLIFLQLKPEHYNNLYFLFCSCIIILVPMIFSLGVQSLYKKFLEIIKDDNFSRPFSWILNKNIWFLLIFIIFLELLYPIYNKYGLIILSFYFIKIFLIIFYKIIIFHTILKISLLSVVIVNILKLYNKNNILHKLINVIHYCCLFIIIFFLLKALFITRITLLGYPSFIVYLTQFDEFGIWLKLFIVFCLIILEDLLRSKRYVWDDNYSIVIYFVIFTVFNPSYLTVILLLIYLILRFYWWD